MFTLQNSEGYPETVTWQEEEGNYKIGSAPRRRSDDQTVAGETVKHDFGAVESDRIIDVNHGRVFSLDIDTVNRLRQKYELKPVQPFILTFTQESDFEDPISEGSWLVTFDVFDPQKISGADKYQVTMKFSVLERLT